MEKWRETAEAGHVTAISFARAEKVAQPDVDLLWKLLENEPDTEITVDLTEKSVLTLRHVDDGAAFEAARPARLPVTTPG